MTRDRSSPDLGTYLDEVVYPALFSRLDAAFPAFGWKRKGNGVWTASEWPADFPFPVEHEAPDRLMVYPDRPWWVKVHGHAGVRFLDLVNGGRKPTGPDFVPAVRRLCELAGVPFPERELSPEETERLHAREARRTALEAVTARAQEVLFSAKGKDARAYLAERGFSDEDLHDLGFGFYDSAAAFRAALQAEGQDLQAAEDAALLWPKAEGCVVIPWADASGQPLTLYFAFPAKKEDRPPGKDKLALPGAGTKGSPLYYDRARRAGHRDLVAVEGVFDAALLQARGDARVVAYVAAQFSGLQVETLVRCKVRSVVVCPDPDGGGDRGALSSVEALTKAGVDAYVAPRLPDGLDPDEFLLREGLDGWTAHVARAVSGAVYRSESIIGNVSPDSPEPDRRRVVAEVLALEGTLRGPRAGLDRADLLRLLEERTAYPAEALLELAEDAAAKRTKTETEQSLRDALRAAQADAETRPALEVARSLSAALASLQARSVEPPPPFSVDRIRKALARKPGGRSSGWEALDDLEVRFHAGELAALVGRPGHAKTAALVGLLLNWLRAAERENSDEVFVFYSFEEPEEFLAARMAAVLSTEGGGAVNGWTAAQVRAFARPQDDAATTTWPGNPMSLEKAWGCLREWEDRLVVVFRPTWTVDAVVAHARDLAGRRRVGGVLVDYWQKVPPPGDGSMSGKEERRDIALAVVGRRLKALAVDLECPVVAGAQAGRETGTDAKKLPEGKDYADDAVQKALRSRRFTMQQIREGGVEQEADLVLGLLNFRADFREEHGEESSVPDVTRLELGILKNRYGPPGKWVGLAFEGRFGLLRDPRRGEVD